MQGVSTLSDALGRSISGGTSRGRQLLGTTTMPVNGIEEVQVARGSWTLVGRALDETLLGGTHRGANVTIHAGGGRDVLGGTVHDDLLDGGRGVDTMLALARRRHVPLARAGDRRALLAHEPRRLLARQRVVDPPAIDSAISGIASRGNHRTSIDSSSATCASPET